MAGTKNKEERIEISMEVDIARASHTAIELAGTAGFSQTGQCMIATATAELARNIFVYALKGEIVLRVIDGGIEIIAEDHGPGIEHIGQAMTDHFSSSGSLGLGLPSVKRLMDEFTIDTGRRRGTKIMARKWV